MQQFIPVSKIVVNFGHFLIFDWRTDIRFERFSGKTGFQADFLFSHLEFFPITFQQTSKMADEKRVKAAENMGPTHKYLVTLSNDVKFLVEPFREFEFPLERTIRTININRDILFTSTSNTSEQVCCTQTSKFRKFSN